MYCRIIRLADGESAWLLQREILLHSHFLVCLFFYSDSRHVGWACLGNIVYQQCNPKIVLGWHKRKCFFTQNITSLWNSPPEDVVKSTCLNGFKRELYKFHASHGGCMQSPVSAAKWLLPSPAREQWSEEGRMLSQRPPVACTVGNGMLD